jgi:hypothetical protein
MKKKLILKHVNKYHSSQLGFVYSRASMMAIMASILENKFQERKDVSVLCFSRRHHYYPQFVYRFWMSQKPW